MKSYRKSTALEGIKKEQLKRRVFTFEFKSEVVWHKNVENLTRAECARKFDVVPKLIEQREKLYDAGQSKLAAGRRAVSPEQAEIADLRAELSCSKIEVRLQKKEPAYLAKESL